MNLPKTIFKIIIVFLFLTQNSFATTPIPGVGVVIKKNPGGGSITVPTGNGGGFSTQLEEGEYELSFPQDQLQTSINSIVKSNFPKSNYQYDGSGVEMVLDNSQITVNAKATKGNVFAIDKQNSSITITVPKGGATLSGKLSWNDAVMTNSKICPEGFTMQNGECVSNNISGNQQARTEGKTKGKIKDPGPKSPMITAENHNNSNGPSLNVSLNANGGTSSSSGVDNSFSFNPNLGIAIHWKNFGIGLDVGTFNTKPNFDFDAYTAPLQNLDFLTITNTKSDWTSTYFMLGPEYTIPLNPSPNKESGRHTPFHNKLTFTVALKGGLTINKAPEFSVMDSNTPPKSIASYTAPQNYKANAFSLKPSIAFAYWINENLALTANAQYLIQTGQQEFTTGYRDFSNVNLEPPVSPIQFQEAIATAPKVMTTTKGPENYMSFGFGVTYSLRKGWDGSIKGNKTVEDTSNETQRIGWDGSIKGKNIAEKGITENGLKKNDVETTPNETQRKGIKEQGLPKNEIENIASDGDGTKAVGGNPTGKKGWDGSIKGTKTELVTASDETQRKGITEKGLKKNDVETASNETQRKGINEKGLPKNDVETASNETQRKGIRENGLKKNDVETTPNETQRKGIKENGLKKNDVETAPNETQRKGIKENGLKKNELSVEAAISEKKGLNAVNVKMSKADSGKKSPADGLTTGNKAWTCPCCKSEFEYYAPAHETKCCDLKFILSDINRPFNENDDVTFVENVAISIKSNISSAIIPSQIALVYRIKQDDKGKLYAIPSIIFGVEIPQDSIPNYTLGCNSPCAAIGIAGNCGGFCYRLLPMDRPPQDYGPSEGPITFNPNSTGTIVFIKDEKLTSIEQTNINSIKYTISTTGKINTSKIFSNPNFCYMHIEGYGTIAFEHIFSATCETASNYIKELYSKTHKTQ